MTITGLIVQLLRQLHQSVILLDDDNRLDRTWKQLRLAIASLPARTHSGPPVESLGASVTISRDLSISTPALYRREMTEFPDRLYFRHYRRSESEAKRERLFVDGGDA